MWRNRIKEATKTVKKSCKVIVNLDKQSTTAAAAVEEEGNLIWNPTTTSTSFIFFFSLLKKVIFLSSYHHHQQLSLSLLAVNEHFFFFFFFFFHFSSSSSFLDTFYLRADSWQAIEETKKAEEAVVWHRGATLSFSPPRELWEVKWVQLESESGSARKIK